MASAQAAIDLAVSTLLLAEGVHPRVVMELLGHSAMRTYSHVLPALAQQAADKIGAALWGAPEPAAKVKKKPKGKKTKKTATKTNEGPHPEGESPDQKGGAEGTRTPDPHTARVVPTCPITRGNKPSQ